MRPGKQKRQRRKNGNPIGARQSEGGGLLRWQMYFG
jgi:hypothetical protein